MMSTPFCSRVSAVLFLRTIIYPEVSYFCCSCEILSSIMEPYKSVQPINLGKIFKTLADSLVTTYLCSEILSWPTFMLCIIFTGPGLRKLNETPVIFNWDCWKRRTVDNSPLGTDFSFSAFLKS